MWVKIRDKPKIKDKSGLKTKHLTVLYRLHNYKKGDRHSQWLCVCDCGNFIELATNDINRSKGCKECAFKGINTKHGKKGTRIYNIWYGMKQRCSYKKDSSYQYYGGRGIVVCDKWLHNFQAFYDWAMKNGYQDNLTIDRIDVNGNYEPSNCRWADYKTQNNNRSNNIYINVNDERISLKRACEKYNKNYRHELRKYHEMSREAYERKFICKNS